MGHAAARSSPRRRTLVVLAALVGLLCARSPSQARSRPDAPARLGQGPIEPTLAIRTPASGIAVVGDTPIDVAVPSGERVVRMTIFVDGRELCTLERRPWSCRWDAGREIREHHLRVVATLTDGRRLVANRRTQGLDVAESVEVSAVQVPVLVTDRHGRFVRGLKGSSTSSRSTSAAAWKRPCRRYRRR